MKKIRPTMKAATTSPTAIKIPARAPWFCKIPELFETAPKALGGFATTCVRVVSAPSGSVEVLIIVTNGGVVTTLLPLPSVDVDTTAFSSVIDGWAVTSTVLGVVLDPRTTVTEVVKMAPPVVLGRFEVD